MILKVETKYDIGDHISIFIDGFITGIITKCEYRYGTVRYLVALDNEEIRWFDEVELDSSQNEGDDY